MIWIARLRTDRAVISPTSAFKTSSAAAVVVAVALGVVIALAVAAVALEAVIALVEVALAVDALVDSAAEAGGSGVDGNKFRS